jgi:hypothetical protein
MDLKKAKDYYELDALTGFDIVKDPTTPGWLLVAIGQEDRFWTMETALKKTKIYSSIDSAMTEIERITGRISSLHVSI